MAKSSKASSKKSSNKRTTIAPNGDKRYVKRNAKGEFKESDDVGKSLSQDVKRKSKTTSKPGYGDQGDQSRGAKKSASPKKSVAKKSSSKAASKKGK